MTNPKSQTEGYGYADLIRELSQAAFPPMKPKTYEGQCPECGATDYEDIPEYPNIVQCSTCGHPRERLSADATSTSGNDGKNQTEGA